MLVLVGSWRAGVNAVGQAQSPSGSQLTQSSIDALVLKGLQWRSIGPARGGRSIAASTGDGKPIANAAPILKDLSAELKVQTDRLAQVLAADLPPFNAESQRVGVGVVAGK